MYDCNWYSEGDRCASYGDILANEGKTANQACCVCGGGSSAVEASQPRAKVLTLASDPAQTEKMKRCGCPSCTPSVLKRDIGMNGEVVGDEIDWVVEKFDYTEREACILICTDLFWDICNECDPTSCN